MNNNNNNNNNNVYQPQNNLNQQQNQDPQQGRASQTLIPPPQTSIVDFPVKSSIVSSKQRLSLILDQQEEYDSSKSSNSQRNSDTSSPSSRANSKNNNSNSKIDRDQSRGSQNSIQEFKNPVMTIQVISPSSKRQFSSLQQSIDNVQQQQSNRKFKSMQNQQIQSLQDITLLGQQQQNSITKNNISITLQKQNSNSPRQQLQNNQNQNQDEEDSDIEYHESDDGSLIQEQQNFKIYQHAMQKKDKFFTGNKALDEAIMLLIFKRRENRSEEDIQKLIRASQDMNFFRKINEKKSNNEHNLHYKLCKAMDHQYLRKGKVVFYQKAHSDNFFILLKGKVVILIQKTDQEIKQEINDNLLKASQMQENSVYSLSRKSSETPKNSSPSIKNKMRKSLNPQPFSQNTKFISQVQRIFNVIVFQRAVKRLIILRNFFKHLKNLIYASSEDLNGSDSSSDISSTTPKKKQTNNKKSTTTSHSSNSQNNLKNNLLNKKLTNSSNSLKSSLYSGNLASSRFKSSVIIQKPNRQSNVKSIFTFNRRSSHLDSANTLNQQQHEQQQQYLQLQQQKNNQNINSPQPKKNNLSNVFSFQSEMAKSMQDNNNNNNNNQQQSENKHKQKRQNILNLAPQQETLLKFQNLNPNTNTLISQLNLNNNNNMEASSASNIQLHSSKQLPSPVNRQNQQKSSITSLQLQQQQQNIYNPNQLYETPRNSKKPSLFYLNNLSLSHNTSEPMGDSTNRHLGTTNRLSQQNNNNNNNLLKIDNFKNIYEQNYSDEKSPSSYSQYLTKTTKNADYNQYQQDTNFFSYKQLQKRHNIYHQSNSQFRQNLNCFNTIFARQNSNSIAQNQLQQHQLISPSIQFLSFNLQAKQKLQDNIKSLQKQLNGLNFNQVENSGHFFTENIFRYHIISSQGNGSVFGELGLLNKTDRSATILCLDDCHFGVLSAEDYQKILMKVEKAKFMKQVRFIGKAVTSNLSLQRISRMVYMFEKRKFRPGEQIYNENDTAENVYLIKKGCVELHKKYLSKKKLHLNIRIAQLGQGEFFGECDLVLDRPRKFNATAFDNCTILIAPKKQFFRHFMEIQSFKNKINVQVKQKEIQREYVFQNTVYMREQVHNIKQCMEKLIKKEEKRIKFGKDVRSQSFSSQSFTSSIQNFSSNLFTSKFEELQQQYQHQSVQKQEIQLEQQKIIEQLGSEYIFPSDSEDLQAGYQSEGYTSRSREFINSLPIINDQKIKLNRVHKFNHDLKIKETFTECKQNNCNQLSTNRVYFNQKKQLNFQQKLKILHQTQLYEEEKFNQDNNENPKNKLIIKDGELQVKLDSKFIKKVLQSQENLKNKNIIDNIKKQNQNVPQTKISIPELWQLTRDVCVTDKDAVHKLERAKKQKIQDKIEKKYQQQSQKAKKSKRNSKSSGSIHLQSSANNNLNNKKLSNPDISNIDYKSSNLHSHRSSLLDTQLIQSTQSQQKKENETKNKNKKLPQPQFEGAGYFASIISQINSNQNLINTKNDQPEYEMVYTAHSLLPSPKLEQVQAQKEQKEQEIKKMILLKKNLKNTLSQKKNKKKRHQIFSSLQQKNNDQQQQDNNNQEFPNLKNPSLQDLDNGFYHNHNKLNKKKIQNLQLFKKQKRNSEIITSSSNIQIQHQQQKQQLRASHTSSFASATTQFTTHNKLLKSNPSIHLNNNKDLSKKPLQDQNTNLTENNANEDDNNVNNDINPYYNGNQDQTTKSTKKLVNILNTNSFYNLNMNQLDKEKLYNKFSLSPDKKSQNNGRFFPEAKQSKNRQKSLQLINTNLDLVPLQSRKLISAITSPIQTPNHNLRKIQTPKHENISSSSNINNAKNKFFTPRNSVAVSSQPSTASLSKQKYFPSKYHPLKIQQNNCKKQENNLKKQINTSIENNMAQNKGKNENLNNNNNQYNIDQSKQQPYNLQNITYNLDKQFQQQSEKLQKSYRQLQSKDQENQSNYFEQQQQIIKKIKNQSINTVKKEQQQQQQKSTNKLDLNKYISQSIQLDISYCEKDGKNFKPYFQQNNNNINKNKNKQQNSNSKKIIILNHMGKPQTYYVQDAQQDRQTQQKY